MDICVACMCRACRIQKKASDSLEQNYRWLQAAIWVLGIEPGSYGGKISALSP